MNRRVFFAALAGLPFAWRFVKKPDKPPLEAVEWGGPAPVFHLDTGPTQTFSFPPGKWNLAKPISTMGRRDHILFIRDASTGEWFEANRMTTSHNAWHQSS